MPSYLRIRSGNLPCCATVNVTKPCCGLPLSTAAVVIAWINMLLSIAVFSFILIFLGIVIVHGQALMKELLKENVEREYPPLAALAREGRTVIVFVCLGFMIGCLAYFYLGHMLLRGARARNYQKLNRWWQITATLFAFTVLLNFIIAIVTKEGLIISSYEIVDLSYMAYTLWVVHCFKAELNQPEILEFQPV